MAVTRASGRLQGNPPTTPPFQIIKVPKIPPGAPTKARAERGGKNPPSIPAAARFGQAPRTPPAQITRTPFSPPGAPSAGRFVDRILHSPSISLPESISTPSEPDLTDILTIPPYPAQQIQMILWLSWTTTATPYQIARMHNRAFREASHIMSCWNVVNIENDVATNWHERGGSFTGMEPMSLLVPPPDNNRWSCLCDFGIEKCWDYKRDQESAENAEKLATAASLWAATPQQMLRCPHGRKKPRQIVSARAPLTQKPLLRHRLEAVWNWLVHFLPIPLRGSHFAKLWIIVDSFYSISESGRKGWISDHTAQYLLYTWVLGTIFLLTPLPDAFLAVSWYCIGWWALICLNSAVPPRLAGEKLVMTAVAFVVVLIQHGLQPRALKAILIFLYIVWALLVAITMLDIDRDFGSLPGWAVLGFGLWVLKEVEWDGVLLDFGRFLRALLRTRWFWIAIVGARAVLRRNA